MSNAREVGNTKCLILKHRKEKKVRKFKRGNEMKWNEIPLWRKEGSVGRLGKSVISHFNYKFKSL